MDTTTFYLKGEDLLDSFPKVPGDMPVNVVYLYSNLEGNYSLKSLIQKC